MSAEPRVLLNLPDAELRGQMVADLARFGIAGDGVSNAAAAGALLGVSRYAAVVIEVDLTDGASATLLADIARAKDRPFLIVVAPSDDPQLCEALKTTKPDHLLVPPFDETRLVSVLRDKLVAEPKRWAGAPQQATIMSARRASIVPISSADPFEANISEAPTEQVGSKAIVAIRLAEHARATQLAASLREAGFAGRVVSTTDELHALLNRDRVDLLILDAQLPGFLSGLDVLEMFQRELLRPDALLLCDCRRSDVPRLETLRPARVLPAASEIQVVAETARSLLTQRQTESICVTSAARRLVADHSDLRPMPQLLVKLTGYLAKDASSISVPELARDIQSDPRATAELLRFTNSAALGLCRRVTGVADALALIGARRSIVLILSRSAVASSLELISKWSEPLQAWYQRRSVLTAGAAQAFSRLEGVATETAFLLGLLQDLGVAVMADTLGERYVRVVERARTVPQLQLHGVEKIEFGFTHADVSAALLQKWELPNSLISPVLAHHGDHAHLSKTALGFVRVMRIGEALSDLSDRQCPQRRQILNQLLSTFGPAEQAACPAAISEAVARAVEAGRLLALPIPEGKSMEQLATALQDAHEEEFAVTA